MPAPSSALCAEGEPAEALLGVDEVGPADLLLARDTLVVLAEVGEALVDLQEPGVDALGGGQHGGFVPGAGVCAAFHFDQSNAA